MPLYRTLTCCTLLVLGLTSSANAQAVAPAGTARALFERIFFLGDDPNLSGDVSRAQALQTADLVADGVSIAVGTAPRLSSAGFSFTIDSATGEPRLRSNSYGSLYVERALTNGKGIWSLGFTYQRSSYDQVQGESFDGIPIWVETGTFSDGYQQYSGYYGVLDVNTDVAMTGFSYGVTDRLDIAATIPLVHVDVEGRGVRRYQVLRDWRTIPGVDANYPGGQGEIEVTRGAVSNTGLGDIGMSAKFGLTSSDRGGVAVVGEVRLPTGDHDNFRGAGKAAVRGGLVTSAALGSTTSVHGNAGFTGGGVANGFTYAAGVDQVLLGSRLTVSFNLIGDVLQDMPTGLNEVVLIDNPIAQPPTETSRAVLLRQFAFLDTGAVSMMRGAASAKYHLGNQWLLVGSALFRMNDNGVQAKVVPTIGLEKTWTR